MDLEERDLQVGRLCISDRQLTRVQQSLEGIGRLTAIDGATLVTHDLTVLGFGAKIKPAGKRQPKRVLISEPFEGAESREASILDLAWGMRHRSAAQFVYDQRDAMAVVASQDGRLSVFLQGVVKEDPIITVIQNAESLLL